MCLLLLAREADGRYPLVVAANRDEHYERPAQPLAWWPDRPDIAGGRDGLAGGTWLGVRRDGRFAAVLNDARREAVTGAPSRGELVPEFLLAADPDAWIAGLAARAHVYAGFHLVAGGADRAWYRQRDGAAAVALGPGVHGIDNSGLDTGDARLARALEGFTSALSAGAGVAGILDALGDDRAPQRARGGDERPVFVRGDRFGTRCSTVFRISGDGRAHLVERRFGPRGRPLGEQALEWDVSAPVAGAGP